MRVALPVIDASTTDDNCDAFISTYVPWTRSPDEPPAGGQAFADTMEGFTTLQTAVTEDPSVFCRQNRRWRGVLHLRSDGAMALQNRVAVRL